MKKHLILMAILSVTSCVSAPKAPLEPCAEAMKRFVVRREKDGLTFASHLNIGNTAGLLFVDKAGVNRGLIFGTTEDLDAVGAPPKGRFLSEGECRLEEMDVRYREFEYYSGTST